MSNVSLRPNLGPKPSFVTVSSPNCGLSLTDMTLYGAVELGGTKTDVAFGTTPDDLSEATRIPTTTPDETLGSVIDILNDRKVAAVGVACFGPIHLGLGHPAYGTMLNTPKPHWSGEPVYKRLQSDVAAPIGIDTDVNGAAIGEGRWGAAQGLTNYAYLTVGTGIGAGVVVAEQILRGERHTEVGHITVRRLSGDTHPGGCIYHQDCLEGMTSGPALEARFGPPETWAGNDSVLDMAARYLAQGLLNLVYTVGPERIIVGGGVSALPGFHERLRTRLGERMAGYPEQPDLDLLVSQPGLGGLSGLAGALILAADQVS